MDKEGGIVGLNHDTLGEGTTLNVFMIWSVYSSQILLGAGCPFWSLCPHPVNGSAGSLAGSQALNLFPTTVRTESISSAPSGHLTWFLPSPD
jgi:hypothetical protein